MFRASVNLIAGRLTEAVDDMLLGDFDYISDGERLYADVDFRRRRSESAAFERRSRRRPACAGLPIPAAAGRQVRAAA